MEIARGEYFCFVDSDDMLMPGAVEELYGLCVSCDAEMAQCGVISCSEERHLSDNESNEKLTSTSINPSVKKKEEKIDKTRVYSGVNKFEALLLKRDIRVEAWAKLYHRALFEESGLCYPDGRLHEDEFIIHKLLNMANRVAVGDYTGYVYRKRSGSIMHQGFSEKRFDRLDSKLSQLKFIQRTYPGQRALISAARAGVVYSCCLLLVEMSAADCFECFKKREKELRYLYKSYGWDYILRSRSIHGKILTVAAYISPRIAMKLLRIYNFFCKLMR